LRVQTSRLLLVLVLLLLAIASAGPVSAAKIMLMQASFNLTQTELGVSVLISGRVFESNNASIPNAVISIQINDPLGTTIRVAIAYSNPRGAFQDTFLIASDSPGGNYTAFIVADKPGYDTARTTLNFTYSTPDFSVEASPTTIVLQQGQTGSLTVTVLSLRGFNQAVNLTTLEKPSEITLQFNPVSVVPSGTSTLSVTIPASVAPGNYTVTLLAISGSLSHRASFQLIVTQSPVQADYSLMFGGLGFVLAVGVVGFAVRARSRRKRREAALEELLAQAKADTGYVATARVIARLEELRAMGKVDEDTYQRLKKEYEKRLEKSK